MPPALSPSSLRQRPLESARLAPRLIAIAIAGAFSGTYAVPAMALPTGAQVAAGQAVVTKPQANVLNIQSAPNTIINWQQFNIGASESVRIQQQSAASAILNRVVGGEASKILGQLSSNGRVFLINPSGIVFGQGARIDTAGFIASSLNISDANFLAGKLTFEGTHKNGIKNEGTIKSLGEIILIAPKIENSGILQTEGGDIILAAGQKVTITNLANPEVLVEIKAPDNEVVNLGRILSNGGAISVLANRLRHSGEINATRAEVGPGGRITLSGDDELTITPDAKVISNGSPAGQITLQSANGTTTIEGTIEARGIAPNPAQVTASTRGGRIEVLGQEVTLASTAVVDASGERGGGAIYIGGDYQGGSTPLPERWALNPATQPLPASTQAAATRAETLLTAPVQSAPVMTEAPPAPPSDQSGGSAIADQPLLPPVRNPLQNSRTTTIASGARVRADARSEGDGGTIIVWSEASTRVYGSLSARGGALGGNGGFVETSGRRYLDIGAIPPDLGASKGLAGLWLLDPNNITIQATGSDTNISGSPNFVSTADGAIITIATIKAALDAGTSVTISTSGGGAQLGDITIGSALATTSATDVTLTLNAHNNIAINAGLSATGTGKLNVVLNANTDAAGGGAASLNSSASLALKGGTVSSGNGSALTITSGTLNNVTLATNVNVTGSATFQNGLTLDNATVTITGASFYYSGTQTLGGTGNVVFAGSSAWLYR
ncbi:MAG TPA: filamentous hemagglutinin N-terminal domain-containing protein, partial [Azospira sp.]|nr:filamentous hemagglutinin N-terminal domain-containing protein [Azospira sp.]